jgi:hypothetical protein
MLSMNSLPPHCRVRRTFEGGVHRILAVVLLLVAAAPAAAQEVDDAPADRERFALALGGGLAWQSATPDGFDLSLGGQAAAHLRLEVDPVFRLDGDLLVPDLAHPDRLQAQSQARLLFVVVQDFTYRRCADATLLRAMAGFGGDIGLPDDIGIVGLNVGGAMLHLEGHDQRIRQAYGAYAGVHFRLRLGPVESDLSVAVQTMWVAPEEVTTDMMEGGLGGLFDTLQWGVTARERFYLALFESDVVSVGPVLTVQYETLFDGAAFVGTLGIAGRVGL